MFVDFLDTPAPPPWPPRKPPQRLTERQRRVVAGVIGLNLLLLLVAPIGGATLFAAIAVLWH